RRIGAFRSRSPRHRKENQGAHAILFPRGNSRHLAGGGDNQPILQHGSHSGGPARWGGYHRRKQCPGVGGGPGNRDRGRSGKGFGPVREDRPWFAHENLVRPFKPYLRPDGRPCGKGSQHRDGWKYRKQFWSASPLRNPGQRQIRRSRTISKVEEEPMSKSIAAAMTFISDGTQIVGDVKVEHDLRVEGYLKGTVMVGGMLVLGPTGKIEGEVMARSATIAGQIRSEEH